jgi:nucleoside-diphosphate-sugar epimerase
MQVILGAGGAVGIELARALKAYAGERRLVSRNPRLVNRDDQLFPADLTRREEVIPAVRGAKTVYLTVGLPYRTKTWQEAWPVIMRNVIEACRAQHARLVFFDNVYMYDPRHLDGMTEETPIGPVSRKGRVRAEIADMFMGEVDKGRLQGLIARSADFYGPSLGGTGILTEMVFNNFARGRKANWLGSAHCKHSFTYTPDAGRATALLGNTDDAYGQVWHLPTAADPPTGKGWIELIARAMGAEPGYRVAGRWMVRAMGLFVPVMREMVEMLYQYDRDYVFDSSKFNSRFDMRPTSWQEGVDAIAAGDYGSSPPGHSS